MIHPLVSCFLSLSPSLNEKLWVGVSCGANNVNLQPHSIFISHHIHRSVITKSLSNPSSCSIKMEKMLQK